LHALLTEFYGAFYKASFLKLKGKGTLDFFQAFSPPWTILWLTPLGEGIFREEKVALMREAGGWKENFHLEVLRFGLRLTIKLLQNYREVIKSWKRKRRVEPGRSGGGELGPYQG
jgi:hypothetical protein